MAQRVEFTDTPTRDTTVTVKIEDTAKGARLEVKVEHSFDVDEQAPENLDYIKGLIQGVYDRLEGVRASRPII